MSPRALALRVRGQVTLTKTLRDALHLEKGDLLRVVLLSEIIMVERPKKNALDVNAKDQLVVGAALAAKITHFVTGNKRLRPELKRAGNQGFSMISPRDMLEALAS